VDVAAAPPPERGPLDRAATRERHGPRRTPAGIADGSNAAQGALGQRRDGRARSPTARGGHPHRLPDNPAPQPVAHVPARSRRLPRYWAGPDRPIAVRQLVSYGPRYTRAEGAPRSQHAALIEEQAQHRPRRTRWPDSLIALPGACCAPGVGRRPAIHRQRHARHRPPTRAAVVARRGGRAPHTGAERLSVRTGASRRADDRDIQQSGRRGVRSKRSLWPSATSTRTRVATFLRRTPCFT